MGEAEGDAGAGGARARSAPVPRGRASDGQGGWVGLRTSAKGAVKVRHPEAGWLVLWAQSPSRLFGRRV